MIYAVEHTDATAVVEFKSTDCKTVVFTMDAADGGHAFRIRLRPPVNGKKTPGSDVLTYAARKPDDQKAELIVLNSDDVPHLKNDEWQRIEVTVVGDKATVKIGDKSIDVQHERIAQKKSIAKLGFSFGALSIRKFTLEEKQ